MANSEDNSLRIETDSLDVVLRGSAADVARAYQALRPLVVERLESTLDDEIERSDQQFRLADDATAPLHRPPEHDSGPGDEAGVVQVVFVRDSHTKAYVVEVAELEDSPLGGSISPTAIRRIYTDTSAETLFDDLALGETVWRELTAEGQYRVERQAARAEQSTEEESDDS